ncbi:plasmid mobilization protein [Fundidesulfovibrio terrae]|uniref:plasmid mobilization protein n=1 Tax=Fundidesulfovibrio terrae TaxID=2922866 RepID=UPI00311A9DC7
MKERSESRTAWIKLRVAPTEKEAITAKARAQGQTVTDFIRQRAMDYRLRQTPLEKEHIRQLARIGANLNQLARWANTYKSRAEAIRVLAALLSIERALKCCAGAGGNDRQASSLLLESKPSSETPCT